MTSIRQRRGVFSRSTISLGVLTVLSGCMVGPNFQPPKAVLPLAYLRTHSVFGSHAVQNTDYVSDGVVNPQWWESFNDPVLTKLETMAVQQNLELQIATQRLFAAQAQAQMQGAVLYPSLGASGSYTRSKISENSPTALMVLPPLRQYVVQPGNLYQYGLQTMFDLDLWGKNRRTVEAAIANAHASEEARRAALLNVEANVASDYIQLRGTETVLNITQQSLQSAKQLVQLTEERQAAGLTTRLDVADAQATAAQISAQLPSLIAQRDALIEQIGLLLGETPDGLPQDLLNASPVPLTPPVVPVGLPSTLLARRPDVREALDTLHAATAQIGVAEADFLPDISLSAGASLQSLQFKSLNEWKSLAYNFGPTISLPIFEGGMLHGQLKLSQAQQKIAAISYAQTVLTAFTQVDTALVTYTQEHDTQTALKADVTQTQIALGLAEEQYKEGLVDYLTVINAQQAYLSAQQAQATSLQRLGTDLVTLYQALGGGWEQTYPVQQQQGT